MNLTDSEILKFQCGCPVFLEDICAIYPVTLREIVELGYDNFVQYLSLLTTVKPATIRESPELNEIIKDLTDFQYILMTVALDPQANQMFKDGFRFFCKENINFSLEPAQIIVGPIKEQHLLTEDKFYDFQRILRRMYFLELDGEEIIINETDDVMTRNLKMKMRENREKVRRAKAKKSAQDKSDLNFSDLIGSVTINNCGLNMINVWDITYYAFNDQLKRMGWRDQFNINNQAAMAGAKMKKSQLKHWMRSIANSDKT